MAIPSIRLKPRHDKRARSGHPWVFSNEIADDVASLPPGGAVEVQDASGALLGRGYANPASLIAVRLLTSERDDIDHPVFWSSRIRQALRFRNAALPGRTSYRLVHGEADGLPGLVVDCYNEVVVVQLTALGTEVRRELIGAALREVVSPTAAVLRSEGPARQLEGLEDERGPWFGEPPDHVDIDEHGVRFRVPLVTGQKTGHFFDQTENRRLAGPLCRGRTVLDVYANGGGWALHALAAGATSAITVDKSEACAEQVLVNADLNGVADRIESWQAEGRATLRRLVAESARFGVVVLDPPAFAKTRKAAGSALRGYREINSLGMALVEPGGWLFTSSCSWHVREDRFEAELQAAARRTGRGIRIARRGGQSPDHPVIPGIPETRYLKSYGLYVV